MLFFENYLFYVVLMVMVFQKYCHPFTSTLSFMTVFPLIFQSTNDTSVKSSVSSLISRRNSSTHDLTEFASYAVAYERKLASNDNNTAAVAKVGHYYITLNIYH